MLPTGAWPEGPFGLDAPEELSFYVEVVRRLRGLCDDRASGDDQQTVADIASAARLSTATVYNILEGRTWGEVLTIYRLESQLGARLWHHEHLDRP